MTVTDDMKSSTIRRVTAALLGLGEAQPFSAVDVPHEYATASERRYPLIRRVAASMLGVDLPSIRPEGSDDAGGGELHAVASEPRYIDEHTGGNSDEEDTPVSGPGTKEHEADADAKIGAWSTYLSGLTEFAINVASNELDGVLHIPGPAGVEIAELEASLEKESDGSEIDEHKDKEADRAIKAWADSAGPAGDLFRQYLSDVERIPVLPADLEVQLAQAVEAGLDAEVRLNFSTGLPPHERRELAILVLEGQAAKRRLIEANLSLVVSIAKRYLGRGTSILDLVQEGNLGLIRAVERYDYTRGYKFSTYATWWIRQAMSRALADQAPVIRVPVQVVELMNRVVRLQRRMLQENGVEPSPDDIAEDLGVAVERVAGVLRLAQEPVSLHPLVGEEDDVALGDLIEEASAVSPVDSVAVVALREHLDALLSTLDERAKRVVQLRYGLTDGQPRTLEEIGRTFGVTRERIRQIESTTLAKLRRESERMPSTIGVYDEELIERLSVHSREDAHLSQIFEPLREASNF